MFPESIQKYNFLARGSYRIILYLSLLIWLLPLIAIILTSFRSLADISSGNYWGWPSEFSITKNYTEIFLTTPMLKYFVNSIIITIPTVIGTLALSCLLYTSDAADE